MKHYDVICIGSGGGAKIAQALARLGRRVALVEKDRAGGTCLNRGCIPSKMLIQPAHLVHKLRGSHRHAIKAEVHGVDFEALIASINTYTDGVSDGIVDNFDQLEHVDFVPGEARFVADKVIEVAGRRLSADTVIIATGSRPLIPELPGLAGTPFMTSTEALRNRRLPVRLAVLGGGYIAAELGGAYAALGSAVTFILRSTFLRREDPEIVDEFVRGFSPGKTIHAHTRVDRVDFRRGVFTLDCTGAERSFQVETDALLVATGVVPNTDSLALENTGIRTTTEGFIEVDDHLRTAVPGVYALGDVTGRFLFRHSVNFEAEYWVDANVLAPEPHPIVYPPMPGAVFTHPEIASVGLTEPQAREQGIAHVIGRAAYPSCAMAVARGLDHGLVKLLFARADGRLLGAHLAGEEASTMIQELVLALTHGMTAEDLYRQIYIHPAFPEVVRNAVRDALKQLDPRRAVRF